MNAEFKKRLFELFAAHAADSLTPEEHAWLQKTLRHDAEARRLWFVHQDVELGLHVHLSAESLVLPNVSAKPTRWLSWRPLTAAAAGIVLGMFCTSLVFAYVAPSLGKAFTLFHEGFEHSPQLVHQAFPTAVGQWSVDTGAVVGPEPGASPKEGGHMLRLEPKADDKFTRAHYVVNLRQIPAFSRSGAHQAQFRVSFRPALVGKTDRYVLRAATFSGGLAQIEPEWMKGGWAEVQDRALSYAAQGGGVSKGTEDWITMTLSINVPAEANLMVLSLWAASMEEKREDRGAHYVDDVTLSFPTSESLP